ncbi:hypothetical protein M404DRAFT_1009237, partial [Pisolithus tinctorius Marx 270]
SDCSTSSEAVRGARGVAFADLNEDVSRIVAFFFLRNARYSGADDRSTTPLFVRNNLNCDAFFLRVISRPLWCFVYIHG